MKNLKLLFLGLIIPFNLNFPFEVRSAGVIDQSSDQAGNAVDGAGAPADRMGPYNTMKGYSGLNEDF